MTPAEFAREIVIPTLEDFRADRTSRRWAYLSAIAVYHLRDYLAEALAAAQVPPGQAAGPSDVKRAMADVDEAMAAAPPSLGSLDIVRTVCNGSKHALVRGGSGLRFAAGTDWERPPMRAGIGQAGLSIGGDGFGGREVEHGDRRAGLFHTVQAVFLAFVAAFPAQLGDCSFDPCPEAFKP